MTNLVSRESQGSKSPGRVLAPVRMSYREPARGAILGLRAPHFLLRRRAHPRLVVLRGSDPFMKQTQSSNGRARRNVAFMRLLLAILRTAVLVTACLATAQADDRRQHRHHENHNYIIERQQAGAVQGVPTLRRIRGGREIDIYSDGSMFEKNNYIGNARRR